MKAVNIRGAITIEENVKENIYDNVRALLEEIIKRNELKIPQISSILFTATRDVTAAYPAVAARDMGIDAAALMCMQEMHVEGSMAMCIRAMLTINADNDDFKANHVYLKGAASLRPDITGKAFSVAIDGPSGAGKSSLAKLLAKELGFVYIDTGAMYRAFGLYCSRRGLAPAEAAKKNVDIRIEHIMGEQRIFLNDEDVTEKIRTQEAAKAASEAAVVQDVRTKLVELQRRLAASKNVIMDGRDIGTAVLPKADVKIYLDAGSSQRAERRYYELLLLNKPCDLETIKKEMEERDFNDMNREISPLKAADDAVIVDTSEMNLEEACAAVLDIIRKRR